jgi:predicted RNA polymerase sigma factor
VTAVDPAVRDRITASALDLVWRDEWGRLLALLVARYRRLDLAEEGLADAFEAATRTWPADGIPANPAAWLLTAARRRIIDRLRSDAVLASKMPLLAVDASLTEEAQRVMADDGDDSGTPKVHDERLRLVLLCAHPSLAPEAGAALTLRLVLGIPTGDIGRLFLVSTPTMAARLTRARQRLAGAKFAIPDGAELEARLGAVADIAYLAFTSGYAPGSGSDVHRPEFAGEAIRLVRILRELTSSEQLDALLALMLLQHARRDARVAEGELVLLPDQDRGRWHADEAVEAFELLTPLLDGPPSRWLLEALIAAEHAVAGRPEDTAWPRIATLYRELDELTGSPVVRLNRAVAVAEADGPLAGLNLLEGLELAGHRLPGARASLLARAGRAVEAREQWELAISLCDNDAERRHLRARLDTS